MGKLYDRDVVAWAREQAEHLRERRWEALDIENLAEEIDSVGCSEKRELRSRMAILMAHLLKWHFQPELRGKSWLRTIRAQRREIVEVLAQMPSLRPVLSDSRWIENAWEDAVRLAANETGLDEFPDDLIWDIKDILDSGFLPD
jgi:hypothetical protein